MGEVSAKRREQLRAADRRFKKKNRKLLLKRQRAWQKANRSGRAAYMRKYRKRCPERFAAIESRRVRPVGFRRRFNTYRRRWAKANPDKTQEYYQRRRARLAVVNNLTAAQIRKQREIQNGRCAYGSHALDNRGHGHVDHKQPLCKGGHNTAANIVISCSQCNLRKGTKTYDEFVNSMRN